MSLTNPNKVVTEERLSDFYQGILPYLGGMPDILANKFSKSDLYSTTEKIVGQWIDGKPVYQKVISTGALSNVSTGTSSTPISIGASVDKFVNVLGWLKHSSGWFSTIPYSDTANSNNFIIPDLYNNSHSTKPNKVGLFYNGGLSWVIETYLIVQYTKTTDSATSIGNDTDYSTTEKIIGTWIDGKPIYQKTVDTGALTNATEKSVAHNISNFEHLVSVNGYARRSSDEMCIPLPDTAGDSSTLIRVSPTSIIVNPLVNRNTFTSSYVTIRYTKTT